ncbi:MAG: hypothetical protein VX794_07090 [Nitrospinota bacterium]|nr:hypothetical protein [Nitrospinota bacterium]
MRVTPKDPDKAEGITAKFFDASKKLRGRIPNSVRAWAHIPHIAKFFLPFSITLQREAGGGVLSSKIKEMVVIKTSHVNNCNY